jgi:hypothetical protein
VVAAVLGRSATAFAIAQAVAAGIWTVTMWVVYSRSGRKSVRS